MQADGSGARRLTAGPGRDGEAEWSRDGRFLIFTRDDRIIVMNADGSDQHRLSLQLGQFVDWSPDGRYLVFSPGLQVIRPDGTGLTSINVAVGAEPEFADWGR
jgi:Tol biopolymer transport system component